MNFLKILTSGALFLLAFLISESRSEEFLSQVFVNHKYVDDIVIEKREDGKYYISSEILRIFGISEFRSESVELDFLKKLSEVEDVFFDERNQILRIRVSQSKLYKHVEQSERRAVDVFLFHDSRDLHIFSTLYYHRIKIDYNRNSDSSFSIEFPLKTERLKAFIRAGILDEGMKSPGFRIFSEPENIIFLDKIIITGPQGSHIRIFDEFNTLIDSFVLQESVMEYRIREKHSRIVVELLKPDGSVERKEYTIYDFPRGERLNYDFLLSEKVKNMYFHYIPYQKKNITVGFSFLYQKYDRMKERFNLSLTGQYTFRNGILSLSAGSKLQNFSLQGEVFNQRYFLYFVRDGKNNRKDLSSHIYSPRFNLRLGVYLSDSGKFRTSLFSVSRDFFPRNTHIHLLRLGYSQERQKIFSENIYDIFNLQVASRHVDDISLSIRKERKTDHVQYLLTLRKQIDLKEISPSWKVYLNMILRSDRYQKKEIKNLNIRLDFIKNFNHAFFIYFNRSDTDRKIEAGAGLTFNFDFTTGKLSLARNTQKVIVFEDIDRNRKLDLNERILSDEVEIRVNEIRTDTLDFCYDCRIEIQGFECKPDLKYIRVFKDPHKGNVFVPARCE